MFRPRRAALAAACGGALVLTGVLAGAGSADSPKAGSVDLNYRCELPGGTVTAAVHLAATVPDTAAGGSTATVTDVSAAVTLPATGFAAATVDGQAQLALTASQGGHDTTVSWPDLTVASTPVPASGNLTLTATSATAAVPVGGSGDVVLDAGDLGLAVRQRAADGSPADPAAVAVACHPADGNAVLARISVPAGGSTTTPAAPSAPGVTAMAPPQAGPLLPPTTSKLGANANGIPPTWCTSHDSPPPPKTTRECAYLVGFSNVKKLGEAAELGLPGDGLDGAQANLLSDNALPVVTGGILHITDHTTGVITLPKATGTFLSFRFVPTTADMYLTQVGLLDINSDITDVAPYPETTTVDSQLNLRVGNVKVNGAPLDVGPDCHISTPLDLKLVGVAPSSIAVGPGDYTLQAGGPLNGSMTIPPFTGCGSGGENLNPLLDAMISGSDNDVKMTQGTLCFVDQNGNNNCPPVVPTPEH